MITVDRIEGEWVVLCFPDESTCTLRLSDLPPNVHAGDVIVKTAEGFAIDTVATSALHERARRLRRKL